MKTLLKQYVAQEEVDTPVTERSCAMLVHTSTTTTCLLRARLNELMLRRKGNTYGPENGTALKLWIDDLNTASSSFCSSGSSGSHEVLRDVVENNGVWESDGRKNYVDLSIVGTLRSSSGGGHRGGSISSRLARHFHIVGMCDAKESEVYKIFTTVMKWHLSTRYSNGPTPFQEDVQSMGFSMVNATYQVHSFLKESFKPTPNGRVHCKQLTLIVQVLILNSLTD